MSRFRFGNRRILLDLRPNPDLQSGMECIKAGVHHRRLMKAKRAKKANHPLSAGCLSLFGLPFFAAGMFISWLYFSPFVNWWNAQRWVEVPCWIESAELKESRGDDSTTYKVVARYHYIYQEKTYQGDRVSFSSGADNVGSFHHDVHRELSRHVGKKPSGAERDPAAGGAEAFRCYVNPTKPSEAVLYRSFRWQMLAFLAIFVLTFPAVGAGLVFGGLIGMRVMSREAKLRESHPNMPWKWKHAWAGDTIPESQGPGRMAMYIYTFWSGLVVLPLILATAWSGAFASQPNAWFLAFFVVLWAIPLSLSIKSFRHQRSVGHARFEPKNWPWWPGGTMQGHLLLEKPLPMRADGEAVLTCRKSISSGSGDNRSTTTETVWTQSEAVPQDRMIRDLTGFRLPISFTLPADAPETSGDEASDERFQWQLEFKVAGTPIHCKFDIPVFRTADSPRMKMERGGESPDVSTSILDDAAADLPALLAARRITANFDERGHPVSFHCPPARHRSMILFLVVFDLIWTAAAVFLVKQDAPMIFQIVWPLSAGVIWLVIFWNLFHQRTATFDPGELRIVEKLGPISWKKSFDKSSIIGFSHDTNMSSGNTRFYRVRLETVMAKKHTIVDGITESNTAEILVRRLQEWKSTR